MQGPLRVVMLREATGTVMAPEGMHTQVIQARRWVELSAMKAKL